MKQSQIEHTVHFGVTDDGTFVAVSESSPHFCFEAETEQAVEQIATRALRFYGKVIAESPIARREKKASSLSRVARTKKHRIPLETVAA